VEDQYIYIAISHSMERPVYKIGISIHPEIRMAQIKADYSRKCELIYFTRASQGQCVENAIHKELRAHLSPLMGRCYEWYEADLSLLKECVERAVRDFHQLPGQKAFHKYLEGKRAKAGGTRTYSRAIEKRRKTLKLKALRESRQKEAKTLKLPTMEI